MDFVEFNISRLNTRSGIVKLSGKYCPDVGEIKAERFDIMGTDGWVRLDLENDQTLKLLADIHHEVFHHLNSRS